jgi:hypothetical protein
MSRRRNFKQLDLLSENVPIIHADDDGAAVLVRSTRALTLWQPWAHAIANAAKRIENRKRKPPADLIGSRIAIHAGKTLRLWDVAWINEQFGYDFRENEIPLMAVVATARLDGYVTASSDPWFFGPFGWRLSEVIALPEPVPCKGALGLWKMPRDIALAVARQEPVNKLPLQVGASA